MASKKFTLQELSQLTQTTFIGDAHHQISGVNSLEAATKEEVSFLANFRYEESLKTSKAGVICINKETPTIEGKNYIISDNPSQTFQEIAELFLASITSAFFGEIHKSAVIHPSVKIGENVTIGPNVVIDQKTKIGNNTHIYPNAYIGPNVEIGENCTIYSNVSVREGSVIGNRVILQPGSVIGSCGFGFLPDSHGKYQKLKQIGNVVIEDDVEIGANSTIDRARFNQTIIKKGTKIDNLVQIAHNVEVGEDTVIAAQSGIAGSTKIGNNVIIGGQVGIAGHLTLSDGVMLAAQAGVSKNLTAGKYRGTPAAPINQWNRDLVLTKQISKHIEKIKKLEQELKDIRETIIENS